MSGSKESITLSELLQQMGSFQKSLAAIENEFSEDDSDLKRRNQFVQKSGELVAELTRVRAQVSPVKIEPIGITLGCVWER